MDSVEKLFAALADPEGIIETDSVDAALKLSDALNEFIKEPASQDPDYQYLLTHAQKSISKGCTTIAYFRQQLAHLAVQKPIQRKDKSAKARQLKYHRWLAHGMKNESFPFEKRKPGGLPSTTRIASLVSTRSCASCRKKGANMRCPDCSFSDDYHILETTSYCNKKCLDDHQKAHKWTCANRRMVYHAASLLDFIFRAMEEATYVYPLSEVYKKNGLVYLVDDNWDRPSMTGRHVFIPFPKHLAESEDIYRALLLWGQAEEITLSLFDLVKYLFKRKYSPFTFCKNMELVYVQPRNVITPVCQISGGRCLNICLYRHTVLRVTLMSNEQYAIDLTGAQFGWKETLAPWGVWADLRATRTDYEPFKIANSGALTAGVIQSLLEGEQHEFRMNLVKAIVKELESAVHAHPVHRSFDQLLKSDIQDYKRAENDIIAMVRHKIYMLVTNECHKDYYRLFMSAGPLFAISMAKDNFKVLKKIWISGKEYDRLKNSGTDMRKYWTERINGKVKKNFFAKAVIATGTTEKSSNAQEAAKKPEGVLPHGSASQNVRNEAGGGLRLYRFSRMIV
ncbi:hypothetical protein F5Y01DRAFT_309708 [Xylaria sp. FL0043]|nr:hypothetical protein F5Y01DRAFT_309708 [Xylaria sp. FL0043]